VKLVGYLFSLAHRREITVEVEDPAILRTVIENAIETVGGRLKDYLVDSKTGKFWFPPIIRVNDEIISGSYDSVTLHEGDTVQMLLPVAGG
jgi:molybdopterin converting factor small subunit